MTVLDEKALLRCPFCNGEAKLDYQKDDFENRQTVVQCWTCGGGFQVHQHDHTPSDIDAMLVDAWNRRASPSQVAPANPAQGEEQTWQKPGEGAAQGVPADEQSGETSHAANPAQGVTDDTIDKAVVEAINALRMEHTGRAYDILHNALTAAIGAGGQAVADEVECVVRFGTEVRRRNRVGDDDERGSISKDSEHAAMMLVINAIQSCGGSSLAHPQPLPLKEEVERMLEIARVYIADDLKRRPVDYDPSKDLERLDGLLSRLRARAGQHDDGPNRYHLKEPTITIDGKTFGEGWLLISEDEYAALRARTEHKAISLSDPSMILAGIKQFGLASDGSDLRDLETAIDRLRAGVQEGDGSRGSSEYYAEKRAREWAVERWNAEVKNRPLVNVHRAGLDTAWRQVIRHFGGDPEMLVGPDHYTLVEQTASPSVSEGGGHNG